MDSTRTALDADWLGACRRAVTGLEAVLAQAPSTAERVVETGTRGSGGDRTLVIDSSAEAVVLAELDAIRNPPGPLDIHGDFPLKPAAKVTSGDIESANLILFGTPETNAVLKRIAPGLPSDLLREGAIFVPIPRNEINPAPLDEMPRQTLPVASTLEVHRCE